MSGFGSTETLEKNHIIDKKNHTIDKKSHHK